MAPTLPQTAVEEDHRLREAEGRASEALARHRWHWTLNPDNPDRVSMREFASRTGQGQSTVREYARAYATFRDERRSSSFTEVRYRQLASDDTEVATEAVAQTRGLTYATTHRFHSPEVRRVRDEAKQQAEERGTSVAEEAPRVAERHKRAADDVAAAERAAEKERKQRREIRGDLAEFERLLDGAEARMKQAAKLAQEIDWSDDRTRFAKRTVGRVKALTGWIAAAYDGGTVDWDEELAALTKEEAQ